MIRIKAGESFEQVESLLASIFQAEALILVSLSKERHKGQTPYSKVSVRPVLLKGSLFYQVTYHYATKEIHENLGPDEAETLISRLLQSVFRQGALFTTDADWQILLSKKGVAKILQHAPSKRQPDLSHDQTKQYLLKEGTPYPFLVHLGVMNKDGKVVAKRYNKFRQLNKFLEIVESCLPALEKSIATGRTLKIVDFGSGKAYLTFALYHYLVEHLQLQVEVIGLDLKEDVVAFGNQVAQELGYNQLKFYHEDIKDYQAESAIDVVVSLHACDLATDYALAQAVKWQAQLILAVPCCQHELFSQIEQKDQQPLLEHGVVKERVAALLTDAARAKLLEVAGYSVTIMEFIDLEHTPKNLLIRAFRESQDSDYAWNEYEKFKKYWKIQPSLEGLLKEDLSNAKY